MTTVPVHVRVTSNSCGRSYWMLLFTLHFGLWNPGWTTSQPSYSHKKKESLTRYELVPQWCTPFCWPIVNFWKKTNKEGYHASKNSTRDLKFQGCSSLLVKLNHFTKLNKTNDFLWLILTIWFLTPNFCQHGVQEGLGVSSDMLVHMLLQYHFHQLETWK